MNPVHQSVRQLILEGDTILDLGCGTAKWARGEAQGRFHLGVDAYEGYRGHCEIPLVVQDLASFVASCDDNSWDVVLMFDSIEHLDRATAEKAMADAERVARRAVIIFTPDGYVPQGPHEEHCPGINPHQEHKCGFTKAEMKERGYKVQVSPNRSIQAGHFNALLAVKWMANDSPA